LHLAAENFAMVFGGVAGTMHGEALCVGRAATWEARTVKSGRAKITAAGEAARREKKSAR
jgi:hypothetical protein